MMAFVGAGCTAAIKRVFEVLPRIDGTPTSPALSGDTLAPLF